MTHRKERALTHIVLNVTDIEGGGWDRQAKSIFLGDKDGLGEAMLFHVAQCELAARHSGHHVFCTVGKRKAEVTLSPGPSLHEKPRQDLRAGDMGLRSSGHTLPTTPGGGPAQCHGSGSRGSHSIDKATHTCRRQEP